MAEPAVVITGAAGGIGRALAERYARDGARLALLDREVEGAEAVARALRDAGGQAWALGCDVGEPGECERAIEEALAQLGGIDLLINNAGITHLGPFSETDPGVIRRVMEINFFGALHCTRAALPGLVERRGRIVVLSSVAGFAPLAGRSGYAASKHALHGLFESLRAELADCGVSVTMVCPSFVRTDIGGHALGADGGAAKVARTEVGIPMEPEHVADVICAAAAARRRLVVIGRVGKLSYWLTRLWPALYERMMLKRVGRSE